MMASSLSHPPPSLAPSHLPLYPCAGCWFVDAADRRPPGRGPAAHLGGGAGQDEPGAGCQVLQRLPLTRSLPSGPEADDGAASAGRLGPTLKHWVDSQREASICKSFLSV